MLILTAKLNKKRLLALVILAAVALAALILSLSDRPKGQRCVGKRAGVGQGDKDQRRPVGLCAVFGLCGRRTAKPQPRSDDPQ